MKAATSIGTDLWKRSKTQVTKIQSIDLCLPVVQGCPEAGSPAQSVGGGLQPLVDPGLDKVGIGDVGDHVIPVVGVVTSSIHCSHLGADA